MTTQVYDIPEQIIRERMICDHDAADGVPTFAYDWAEIRKNLDGMAAGALRVGKRLIAIPTR